jgi:EmrB/QacA subfamily drug resistance transporter
VIEPSARNTRARCTVFRAMRRHWITLMLLTTACVSFAVMQTLVVPALPFFRQEFGTSQADTTWLVTGFLLSSSVLTPLLGKLGDMYGKKRLLVISMSIFGLGSLAAAAGGSLVWLVACRVVQGAGAAVFPLSFGIIRDEFPRERIGVAIGLASSAFGLGGGIGLVGSGFVLDNLGWEWLFVLGGVPPVLAAALIAATVPESPVRRGGRPDFLGAGVFSAALVTLLLGITKGEARGWFSLPMLSLAAASAVCFGAWIAIERRVPEPLVDLRTLAKPAMALTNSATMLVGFSLTAFFVLMPAFVQVPTYGYGASLTEAGLYFVPTSVAMVVCGPAAGWLGTRLGHAVALRIGLASAALALLLLAFEHASPGLALVWLGLLGVGLAFALAAIGSLVIEHSDASETGVASGVNLIMRTVGAAVGAQVTAAVISAQTPAGSLVPHEAGFTIAFALAAAAVVLALVPALAVGHRRRSRRAPLRPALNPA